MAQEPESTEMKDRPGGERVRHGRTRWFLGFILSTLFNAGVVLLALYFAGLAARRHTTAGFFGGIAERWYLMVPTYLAAGVLLTLWNRWVRRRSKKRGGGSDPTERDEGPTD